jgi:hypothetical protein
VVLVELAALVAVVEVVLLAVEVALELLLVLEPQYFLIM